MPNPCYFIQPCPAFKNCLFKYDYKAREFEKIVSEHINVVSILPVFMGGRIYGYRQDPLTMICIEASRRDRKVLTLAVPPMRRFKPSMARFKDRYLFLSGGCGCDFECGLDQKSTVYAYQVSADVWLQAPSLNKARSGHSSCSVANFMYVACGSSGILSESMISVERLNVLAWECGLSEGNSWQSLSFKNEKSFKPRQLPLMCACNNNSEVVILGGLNKVVLGQGFKFCHSNALSDK